MDPCGRFPPVRQPRSLCDACVGRVCHRHCGSDRRSRHPVRLVWVNGSFGCQTIAARTRDLILDTILEVTRPYSTIPVLPWVDVGNLGQHQPEVCGTTTLPPGDGPGIPPPSGDSPGYPLPCVVLSSPPPGFALRRGVKRYPEPHDHGGVPVSVCPLTPCTEGKTPGEAR